ncbi:hypothetical protein CY34DRAFT_17305 [Suillus luteus UH-Slu-Lm8-n1]|uniref:Uncharacterized protein n=1 Tax=Suillus luteus UH-Slu-Lm8-n1 TaxID=930992 RepID=A0A0D0ALA0_9AGAM|nr:hypothetical protein CY34DRAFT_17305 [Suillus luteus UH-Slu-Lm8-n1]
MQAWQRQKITKLEKKLDILESERAVKERYVYIPYDVTGLLLLTDLISAKQTTISHKEEPSGMWFVLFDSIEDLISENDRRYDAATDSDEDLDVATSNQDRLLTGYTVLTRTIPWFLKTLQMEHSSYMGMLKIAEADGARGDDTMKLKTLIADWVE